MRNFHYTIYEILRADRMNLTLKRDDLLLRYNETLRSGKAPQTLRQLQDMVVDHRATPDPAPRPRTRRAAPPRNLFG